MTRQSLRTLVVASAVLVSSCLVGGVWYLTRPSLPGGGAPPLVPKGTEKPSGFVEGAKDAGITFQMKFLPGEQGEKFKINLYDHGCGVAVGDFDGDGHEDIYFTNQGGANVLYRNRGDGTFEDVTRKAGVGLGDRVCVAATFADYDNDGHADLYVTSTRGGNVLFRNNGDGTFTGVTAQAGLTLVAHSQTAVFFDFDNDGLLDLFVTNTAKWTLDDYDKLARYFPGMPDFWQMAGAAKESNVLYRNNGPSKIDGRVTFTDVTKTAGLQGRGWGGDVAAFDHDGDGFLDLFVTNMFGANQLYRNNRDGTFTDVAKKVLSRTSWGAIGCKAFDFDNDGRLDLFIADMHSDMWLPPNISPDPKTRAPGYFTRKYPHIMGPFFELRQEAAEGEQKFVDLLGVAYDDVVFGNTLFRQLPRTPGDGVRFEEVSDRAGMETFWPWGVAVGDFDNDGFEDVFLPSGMGYPYDYWPNALMMNNGPSASGGVTFTDRAADLGIEPPPGGRYQAEKIGGKPAARSSRCAAVADFDGDGRLDLIVNNFNDRPYYFLNRFPQRNHLAFRLTGTKSNRDAVGALVRVYVGEKQFLRQVHAGGGYLSQSTRTIHFGLGDLAAVDRVVIRWPSGKEQVIAAPAINQLHRLTEPK